MPKERYQPTETDKTWLRELLRWIKDGGIWGTSFATYQVDQRSKQLVYVGVGLAIDDDDWPIELNRGRVKAVAEAIGWKVIE